MEYICKVCDKKFLGKPCKKRQFCSKTCEGKFRKGKPRGWTPSVETLHKMSLAQKGHKASLATRKKMSESRKGTKNPNYGKKHSSETRRKISIANKGRYIGAKSYRWKGGVRMLRERRTFYKPQHPFANGVGYVLESRLIAEMCLGRYLDPKEIVHHIDFDGTNNKLENLFIFENQSAHCAFHFLIKNNPFLKTFLESNLI